MSLERRAILAFVLSLLLFLLYDHFYLGPKVKEQQARRRARLAAMDSARTDSLLAKAAPDTGQREEPAVQAAIQAVPESTAAETGEPLLPATEAEEAGRIVLSTPLYRITFSKAGGEIRLAELLGYETAGHPVQLLLQDPDAPGAADLVLIGENRELPLSNVRFEAYLNGFGEALPDGYEARLSEPGQEVELVFRAVGEDGQSVARHYRLDSDSYVIQADVRFTTSAFPFVREISWGFGSGITSTEENQNDDYMNFKASVRLGDEIHRLKPSSFSEEKIETYSGTVTWASLQTKYFTTVLIPETPAGGEIWVTGEKQTHRITANMLLPAADKRGAVDQAVLIYLGPLDYGILKGMGLGLEGNVNMGYRLIRPVSWVILWSLIGLYKVLPNYGVVIILLSIFTKILFYRMTHKSFKSMRDLQSLQPKLQALKEKYKDDRQKLSQETMRLYKEQGVNPLGGCLPLLLQMPVFIALYSVLRFTIEIRGARFMGWITDLSQQDVLTHLPFAVPFIGSEVSVLPLLMGAAMGFQTKMGGSMTPGSVSTQPKVLNYMLPIVFTAFFYKMPSGLVLYWIVNNILTIGQQYYINKNVDKEKAKEAKEAKETKEAREAKEAKEARKTSSSDPPKRSKPQKTKPREKAKVKRKSK